MKKNTARRSGHHIQRLFLAAGLAVLYPVFGVEELLHSSPSFGGDDIPQIAISSISSEEQELPAVTELPARRMTRAALEDMLLEQFDQLQSNNIELTNALSKLHNDLKEMREHQGMAAEDSAIQYAGLMQNLEEKEQEINRLLDEQKKAAQKERGLKLAAVLRKGILKKEGIAFNRYKTNVQFVKAEAVRAEQEDMIIKLKSCMEQKTQEYQVSEHEKNAMLCELERIKNEHNVLTNTYKAVVERLEQEREEFRVLFEEAEKDNAPRAEGWFAWSKKKLASMCKRPNTQ